MCLGHQLATLPSNLVNPPSTNVLIISLEMVVMVLSHIEAVVFLMVVEIALAVVMAIVLFVNYVAKLAMWL